MQVYGNVACIVAIWSGKNSANLSASHLDEVCSSNTDT